MTRRVIPLLLAVLLVPALKKAGVERFFGQDGKEPQDHARSAE